jgi:hypothetical protein
MEYVSVAGSSHRPTTAQIRAIRDEDVPPVADLWLRVFRHTQGPPPASLVGYFREVFLRNPWREDDLPPLVCIDPDGKVTGFLGVIPRRMVFRGRPIRVAVATQLMVDSEQVGSGFLAIELVRRFFAGPQDLSFSDGATDTAAKLWQGLGGGPALLYSLEWVRTFRPARYSLGLLSRKQRLGPFRWAARPFCSGIDAILTRLPVGPYGAPGRPPGTVEEATTESILACWQDLPRKPALHPVYDPESFDWLLRTAAANQVPGDLRKVLVRDKGGRAVGWFVYYLKPGGVSRVLQLAGAEKAADLVLDHLFFDARRNGSVAVEGMTVPRYLRQLDDRRCRFRCLSLGVTIHSRDHELLDTVHRGEAFLSRLDGEWWLRFASGRFD